MAEVGVSWFRAKRPVEKFLFVRQNDKDLSKSFQQLRLRLRRCSRGTLGHLASHCYAAGPVGLLGLGIGFILCESLVS